MRTVDERVLIDLLVDEPGSRMFGLLLGAGCSVSAGVPTAFGIMRDAQSRLFEAFESRPPIDETELDAWLIAKGYCQDEATAYGEALERLRPQRRLRRQYLESFFRDRSPSPAQWELARVVRSGLFERLFTPNFDRLLEESVGRLNTLRVVSYDEQVADLSTMDVPVLYKLHGDYLFDSIRNTAAECQDLSRDQAARLSSVLVEGGLVVAGYSGSDQSIMSIIETAARASIPLGLYWLARRSSPLSARVARLLDQCDDAYVVEIDGFDDFCTALSSRISRRLSATAVIRPVTGAFVAHAGGVGELVERAAESVRQRVPTCISGLPGVGKTSAAEAVLATQGVRSQHLAIVRAGAGARDFPAVLDAILLQVPAPRPRGAGVHSVDALLAFLHERDVVIFVDNADQLEVDALGLLADLSAAARLLLTARDTTPLRAALPSLRDLPHQGLTDGEMRELLEVRVSLDAALQQRYEEAGSHAIEEVIRAVRGWPQAMLLLLAELESSVRLTFADLPATLDAEDVYSSLLEGLASSLSDVERRVVALAGAYPETFTVEGLAGLGSLRATTADAALARLRRKGLVSEVTPGVLAWAHPVIGRFAAERARQLASWPKRRAAATAFLVSWAEIHGGQPKADWSNFKELDREFMNLRALMSDMFADGDIKGLTTVYRSLFSYLVERGHWSFTETWCDRVLGRALPRSYSADWLIWKSWLCFYLHDDYESSARHAEEALALPPRTHWQSFQAHRRAAVAQGRLGKADAAHHYRSASLISAQRWPHNSDEAVDLLNSYGDILLHMPGTKRQRASHAGEALSVFARAAELSRTRGEPNTREIAVAELGRSRAYFVLNRMLEALSSAEDAAQKASEIDWLRGMAEANLQIAAVCGVIGDTLRAASAARLGEEMSLRLRSPVAGV